MSGRHSRNSHTTTRTSLMPHRELTNSRLCSAAAERASRREALSAAAEHNREFVSSRCGIKLVLVVVWLFRECLPLILVQIKIQRAAESRPNRPIGFVRDPQHVHVRVIFSFVLVENER